MRFAKIPRRPTDHVTNEELLHDLLLGLKDIVAFESTISKSLYGNGNGNGNEQVHNKSLNGKNGNGNGKYLPEEEFNSLSFVVQKVANLHNRMNKRGLEIDEALEHASTQIGIDLSRLLHDSLQFPKVIPCPRNLKGLRRLFLCYCGQTEMCDGHGLRLCKNCLEEALECVQEKKKSNKFILYSSYSPQVRCRHADFSTLLVTLYKPGEWLPAWCEICLKQEQQRLAAAGII